MKNLLIIMLIFGAFILGCKPAGPQPVDIPANMPGMNAPPMTSKTPSVAARVIDVPKLVGKSPQEIEIILGKPEAVDKLNATDTTGELSYDYSTSGATFFINFKNNKANYFHFTFEREYPTTFEIGEKVGLELRGVEPVTASAASIRYTGEVAGTIWKEIDIIKKDKGFGIVVFKKS